MQELDFDELDKAVNSLLTSKKADTSNAGQSAAASTPTERPTSVTPPAPRPSTDTRFAPTKVSVQGATSPASRPLPKLDVTRPAPSKPPSAAPPLPTSPGPVTPSRRGAFMDVVQTPKKDKPLTKRPNTVIKPLNAEVKPEQATAKQGESVADESPTLPLPPPKAVEADMLKEPAVSAFVEPQTELEKPESAVHSEWPDPIDFHTSADKPSAEQAARPDLPAPEILAGDATPDITTEQVVAAAAAKAEPPSSPFLPEAKVEKRPLGAFSNFTPAEEPKTEEKPAETTPEHDKDTIAPDDLSLQAAAIETGKSMPPELSKEVMNVEAPEPVMDFENEPAAKPAEPSAPEATLAEPASTPEPQTPLVPQVQSIQPQYHAPEKTVDTITRPVFDTTEYHPPLQPGPGTKMSSPTSKVLSIVLIVVLVIVLAVGGYFAYLYF